MKMTNEVIVLESDQFVSSVLTENEKKNLPTLIYKQVDKLKELDVSIQGVIKSAEAAIDSAAKAEDRSAGFGKKKVAIEELQKSGVNLAKAVQSGAEAQKVSFEFQTKLAEISKYLFGLGVSNIASNRFVVRELELKLKDSSEEEISELARQELLSVVKQLKEQEDILLKLESLTKISATHDGKLNIQVGINQAIDDQIDLQSKAVQQNREQLDLQVEASKRIETKLKSQAENAQKQSEKLTILTKTDEKLEGEIKSLKDLHKLQSVQVKDLKNIALHHSEKLIAHEEVTNIHSTQFENHEEIHNQLEQSILNHASHHSKQAVKITETHTQATLKLSEQDTRLQGEIDVNFKKIEEQQTEIKTLTEELATVKNALNTKASNKLSKVNLGIASVAVIISVVHFFV